ncbi:MAG: 2-isopropylmalate synthase, partial [Spirochaeta sp.]|nr:2-isopropylmalate synthase [Spirochaeta sp.]
MDQVQIFDTTLRDGEQSPGASMDVEQKFEIALQLEHLGVDVIEAGFAVSSPEQFLACKQIGDRIKDSTIAVLARSVEQDIDAAAESLADAARPRIHTFVSTSPIHMEYKLKKKPDEVIEMTRRAVRYARNKCGEVEFSPEDATRSDVDFMCKVLEVAIEEGATILNIPDTVGYTVPEEYAALITTIRNRVPNIDKAILSVHCHDDLGLAVANTISALRAGARQAEVTINGIGERAGNAALEEVVMALKVRKDVLNLDTRIDTRQLYPTSRMLSSMIGFPIPRNKAIIGENAFAHESGIHQHGVLRAKETYEIMDAASVGQVAGQMILGKHSGRAGFADALNKLDIVLEDEA